MSTKRPSAVVLSTTFDPVTYAGIAFLAQREDVRKGAANVPIRRLVREELDERYPGLWDRMVALAHDMSDLSPRERVTRILKDINDQSK